MSGGPTNNVQTEFDSGKRDGTLSGRGLDFAMAGEVFAGGHLTRRDVRQDDAEDRFVTIGWLDTRLVVMVWTPRRRPPGNR